MSLSLFYINHPWMLTLLLVIVPIIYWHQHKKKKLLSVMKWPSIGSLPNQGVSFKAMLFKSLFPLRILSISLIIIALSRPQLENSSENLSINGIDLMMVNDISGSMLAEDLSPNRLEAAKTVAADFIESRPNDRIGIVAFSGAAFTQCPITADHEMLLTLVKQLRSGMIKDGTAIGDGLMIAIDRLRNSDAQSKVIILLTDGINNAGFVDPQTAASIAKMYGVRIYTIGVGSKGKAKYPFVDQRGFKIYDYIDVMIDEEMLTDIATGTDGKYFRATDNKSLENIYKEIDQLEKTRINISRLINRKDIFFYPLAFALILLLIEGVLRFAVIKIKP